MNNADKHIAHWSDTDVQKYLNGELSAREMHDLELQALDDPFLADALEGLQTQPGETFQQDLSELRGRLAARTGTGSPAIPWRIIRVAAAVILLVGLGFTAFYTLLDKKQPTSIATAPLPPAAADQSPAGPPAVAKNAPPAASPLPDKAETYRNQKGPVTKRSAYHPPVAETTPQHVEARELSDSLASVVDDLDKDTLHAVANGLISERKATATLPALTLDRKRISDTSWRHDKQLFAERTVTASSNPHLMAFSGRVLDFNNHPLAGAYLTYRSKGTVTGAVTDEQGQFNLYIPHQDTIRRLTVAMVGYEETQYALNATEQTGNNIYLRQSTPELQEVVVSGIGAQRKEYMAEPPSDEPEKLDSFWLNATPVMGRIAYLDYLASARKTIPVDTTIHGTESISFRVDKKGALTEFRIERSLSPAHDAGVIGIISKGPPWKMLHGRSARALVNVTF